MPGRCQAAEAAQSGSCSWGPTYRTFSGSRGAVEVEGGAGQHQHPAAPVEQLEDVAKRGLSVPCRDGVQARQGAVEQPRGHARSEPVPRPTRDAMSWRPAGPEQGQAGRRAQVRLGQQRSGGQAGGMGPDQYSGKPVGQDGIDRRVPDGDHDVAGESAGHVFPGVCLDGLHGPDRVAALHRGDHRCLLGTGVEMRCVAPRGESATSRSGRCLDGGICQHLNVMAPPDEVRGQTQRRRHGPARVNHGQQEPAAPVSTVSCQDSP